MTALAKVGVKKSRRKKKMSNKFKYESNNVIRTTFDMIKIVIDHWYVIK